MASVLVVRYCTVYQVFCCGRQARTTHNSIIRRVWRVEIVILMQMSAGKISSYKNKRYSNSVIIVPCIQTKLIQRCL